MKRNVYCRAVASVGVLLLAAAYAPAAPTSRSHGTSGGTAAPVYVAPGSYSPGVNGGAYYAPEGSGEVNAAVINLKVPGDAQVWFNDYQTKLTGTTRTFVSPPLQQDLAYRYHVRVRWLENGQEVVQERDVPVAPNTQTTVQFK